MLNELVRYHWGKRRLGQTWKEVPQEEREQAPAGSQDRVENEDLKKNLGEKLKKLLAKPDRPEKGGLELSLTREEFDALPEMEEEGGLITEKSRIELDCPKDGSSKRVFAPVDKSKVQVGVGG
jgi:hypothetical protein